MQHLKLFEEFTDSSLKKIYLAIKRESGHRWWSYKGFAGSKFFIQVNENNIDDIDINPNYPILNYNSSIIKTLLEGSKIKDGNIYNKPRFLHLSGSKDAFHKLVGDDENIPTTVYSKEDAIKKLNFPIIAKPASGHSGLGIKIFKNKEDLNNIDVSKFSTYSEYVDKAEEMRFFTFKGDVIFWMERNPMNKKAKDGEGDASEQMDFAYRLRKLDTLPNDYKKVLSKFSKIYDKLPFVCFDMMKGKNGKIYVIETNTQPGVPFDSTVELYKSIYKDFYKENIDEESLKKLNRFSDTMIKKTLERDKDRFSVE